MYSRKNEEYMADFALVSRRVLGEDTHAYRVFRYHFLLGADWKLCCRKLGIDRGEFFDDVYRIQQKLGLAFRELEPYALFPIDEYFGGAMRPERPIDAVFPLTAAPDPQGCSGATSATRSRIGPQEPLFTAPAHRCKLSAPLTSAAA